MTYIILLKEHPLEQLLYQQGRLAASLLHSKTFSAYEEPGISNQSLFHTLSPRYSGQRKVRSRHWH
jgi:hypothetical protein